VAQVRVHDGSRTTYAPTYPFPGRDTAIRYYVVAVSDRHTVVEPVLP
jgi:hypothetical protein